MRSLPIAVLFSLVSLVAAFGKRGHNLRHTHALPVRCYNETGLLTNETGALTNGTGALTNGTGAFTNGTGALTNGTGAFTNGTGALTNGTGAFTNGTGAFTNGTGALTNETVPLTNQTLALQNQTDPSPNKTDGDCGMQNPPDGTQNKTVALGDNTGDQTGGMTNNTGGMTNNTGGMPNNTGVTNGSRYKLSVRYMGQDFLDETKWSAFTQPDLTNGLVEYVSHDTARSEGMTSVLPNGAAILSVDNKTDLPLNTRRKSMRITTTQTFNGGLFIADFARMPFGCSLWPAYWSYGVANWPQFGEIDILEGVNNQATNQVTLHTGPDCFIDEHPSTAFSGNVLNTVCASSPSDNTGCAIGDADPSSYGAGFNNVGGGVYAHLWNHDGISVWQFPRSSIPQDITSGSPNPSTWPTPVAFFANTKCDMASHFVDHSLVIDTTLCGDWAGNSGVFGNSGCPGTCAQTVTAASNFENAYWEVNSISVYTSG